MHHIIDYYKNRGNQVKKSDGNSWNGNCEKCGGDGRFVIWKVSKNRSRCPEFGRYQCRECGIWGDCISYLAEICGMTFPAALDELGLDNDYQQNNRNRKRRKQPPKRQHRPSQKWKIQPEQHPDFVEDVGAWREHAEKFVNLCHEALLQRQSALDYLAARGVGFEQVKRFHIGFNAGQSSKTKGDYQPAYKQAASWGMPNLQRPNGSHQKTIALNVGLIVPCYQRYDDSGPVGDLLRINIRTFRQGYLISKGSLHFLQAQQVVNPGHDIAVVVESELDAFALSAILPGVTIIPLGSAGGVPGKAANVEFRNKQLILLCLDRDLSSEKSLDRWKKDNPGMTAPVYAFGTGVDRAPEKWFANYPQCQPWYCPAGNFWLPENERTADSIHGQPIKDPGDAIRARCDMAAWFAEGVAYYSVVVPHAIVSPDVDVSKGGGAGESENLLAFAIFWPEYAGKIMDSVKNDRDVFSVCRLMVDNGIYTEGLLGEIEGDLLAKIERILIAGADCWDWSADPDAYLRRITKPSPPVSPEFDWLIDYLERREIDIKVIGGEVSLVFTRALGMSEEGELERVSAALGRDDVAGYLGAAKNGVWRAGFFR